jgi:CubicO group peptidase (beta-lactamase class C family)
MAETRGRSSRRWIIAIAIFIAVSSTGYYLLTRPNTPAFETYEKYGFSFEYPQGMTFTEEGVDGIAVPTMETGILQGTLIEDTPQINGIIWTSEEDVEDLRATLDEAFEQIGEGIGVTHRGELKTSTKDSYEMLIQYFEFDEGGNTMSGLVGTWYDEGAKRVYMIFFIGLRESGSQETLEAGFDRLLSSFESSYTPPVRKVLNPYWPTEGWRTADPGDVGMDSGLLDEMVAEIRDEGIGVDGVTVIRDGYIVLDEYFPPFSRGERHIIYSCTKSVVSTLIGIAIEEGHIEDLDVKVLDLFPDRAVRNINDWKKDMTLRDLLTMTAGFDARDSYLYEWEGLNRMHESADELQHVLDLPVIEEPGTRFEYTNGVSHLLSSLITEKTGMSALDFGMEHLFGPLGIDDIEWHTDSNGRNWGYSRIYITPHDMAKFGYMFLKGGEWDGTQIVPREWVDDATDWHVDATIMNGYGYQWWVSGRGYYTAIGYRGQFIHVVPDLDLVVVFASSNDEQFPVILGLLERYVIPAVAS